MHTVGAKQRAQLSYLTGHASTQDGNCISSWYTVLNNLISVFWKQRNAYFDARTVNVFWQPNSHHFEYVPPLSAQALLQGNVAVVFEPNTAYAKVAVMTFPPIVCIISEKRGNVYDKPMCSIYKYQKYI